MKLIDYHIHTDLSGDSNAKLEDIVHTAIKKNLSEIAITDHLEVIHSDGPYKTGNYDTTEPLFYPVKCVPPKLPINKDFSKLKEKINIINEKNRGKLKVLFGVEISQADADLEFSKSFIKKNPFDIILCSTHSLEKDIDLNYIDLSKCDINDIYIKYLEKMYKQLNEFSDFDIISHINYIIRYIYKDTKIRFDYSPYEDCLREIIKKIAHMQKGIEINTSGLFQGVDETFPSLWLVKIFKEYSGKIITVGSDAHNPQDIIRGYKYALELLKLAGFTKIASFEKRNIKFINIE